MREKRILNKIIVFAFDEGMDDAHILRFVNLSNYPNRILFIDKKRAIQLNLLSSKYIIPIDGRYGGAKLLNFSNFYGKRYYEKYIDIVTYLNQVSD